MVITNIKLEVDDEIVYEHNLELPTLEDTKKVLRLVDELAEYVEFVQQRAVIINNNHYLSKEDYQ